MLPSLICEILLAKHTSTNTFRDDPAAPCSISSGFDTGKKGSAVAGNLSLFSSGCTCFDSVAKRKEAAFHISSPSRKHVLLSLQRSHPKSYFQNPPKRRPPRRLASGALSPRHVWVYIWTVLHWGVQNPKEEWHSAARCTLHGAANRRCCVQLRHPLSSGKPWESGPFSVSCNACCQACDNAFYEIAFKPSHSILRTGSACPRADQPLDSVEWILKSCLVLEEPCFNTNDHIFPSFWRMGVQTYPNLPAKRHRLARFWHGHRRLDERQHTITINRYQ